MYLIYYINDYSISIWFVHFHSWVTVFRGTVPKTPGCCLFHGALVQHVSTLTTSLNSPRHKPQSPTLLLLLPGQKHRKLQLLFKHRRVSTVSPHFHFLQCLCCLVLSCAVCCLVVNTGCDFWVGHGEVTDALSLLFYHKKCQSISNIYSTNKLFQHINGS